MDRRLVITKRNEQILSCFFEDDTLLTVQCEEERNSLVGNLYIGRVRTIVKSMNAAFVEIAKGVNCYLSFADCASPFICNREYCGKLMEGDEILVQVIRDRIKTKDAMVSANLSFSGRYVVLTTGNKKVGFSAKLSKQQKERLKKECSHFVMEQFGYILRTNAGIAVEQDSALITRELQAIKEKAETILAVAKTRTVFSCLYVTPPSYLLKIRDCNSNHMDRIMTDDRLLYEKITAFLSENGLETEFLPKVVFYQDTAYSLAKLVRLEKHLSDALSDNVWLKCGGYLVIEQTEALTVIDVNSGKCVSKKEQEETFYKINQEAAIEIAHQLRLRNLSGIIIIDFINLKLKESQIALLEALKKACKKDEVQTDVVDMTPLGLVEVTRKRVYQSLKEQLFQVKR